MKKIISSLALAVMLSFLLYSCKKNSMPDNMMRIDLPFYAVTSDNQLLSMNAENISMPLKQVAITGLQSGETLMGIDFRPATGQLYGVGSSSRIYVINQETGAARALGAGAFTPAINGAYVGFDFNPTVDRIRLVTSSGQNLRLHPETGGVVATDMNLKGVANAMVGGAAYTENKAGSSTTALYVIDVTTDKLYKQDPPNDGNLMEIGSLGMDVKEVGGFDISPSGEYAIASLQVGNKINLYLINITTGAAKKIAKDFAANITGIAIPTDPVAYAIGTSNELIIFNPITGTQVSKPTTGLAAGDNLLGLDFRPVNGQLYALGSTRLYTINTATGAATAVGSLPFTTPLAGTEFGFDFNPTVDRIRVVSNTGQNLRLHPETGAVAFVDGMLMPATHSITASAYTNNFAGATTTTLFNIGTASSRLYKQDPPNNGTLVEVGPLGVTATAASGFDIGGMSNMAYALLTVNGTTKVYMINTSTGAATPGATLAGNTKAFAIGLGF